MGWLGNFLSYKVNIRSGTKAEELRRSEELSTAGKLVILVTRYLIQQCRRFLAYARRHSFK